MHHPGLTKLSGAFAALLFLIGLSGPAYGQEGTCVFEGKQLVPVSLGRREGAVSFNNTQSRDALTRLQSGAQRGPAMITWASVGLTRTELKYQLRVEIEAYQMRNGRYCARLRAVQADLGYDGFDVFVARRYRPGTCPYKVIVEHELTHVSVFREALDEFYPRMLHRLERIANAQTPFVSSSPNRAATTMQSRLRGTIDPLYREMNRALDRRNARLDTRARYEQERRRCNNW